MAEISFDDLSRIIMADAEEMSLDVINELKGQLVKDIKDLNARKLFLEMSQMLGKASQPNIGAPAWKPLDANYIKKKGHRGFYEFSGNLKREVAGQRASRVFGEPIVMADYKGRSGTRHDGRTDIFATGSRDRYGKSIFGYVAPNSRGRLSFRRVSLSDLLPHQLTVIPFPHLEGVEDAHVPGALFGPRGAVPSPPVKVGKGKTSGGLAVKFTNYKGMQDRPFLGWYVSWWTKTKMANIVSKHVGSL